MPKAMERKLKAIAKKKGFSKERTGAFVYGTMMHKTNWRPGKGGGNPDVKKKISELS